MFLCEAAMGKMKSIIRDDPSLRAAPAGFDSVLAKGNTVCVWGGGGESERRREREREKERERVYR